MKNLIRSSLFILISLLVTMAANADEITDDLALLEKAKVFSCGEVLNQGSKNELFLAYRRLCANWLKVPEQKLESLLKTGTPAAKLYAAALISERYCNRGMPSKMKSGFEELKSDKSKVIYRSGCTASQHSVAEIASRFLSDGQFNEFALSKFCARPIAED